jgi:hypothetical protein
MNVVNRHFRKLSKGAIAHPFEANHDGIAGKSSQGHYFIGPGGCFRRLLLACDGFHRGPRACAYRFYLHLQTSYAVSEHMVPKAQFWAAGGAK